MRSSSLDSLAILNHCFDTVSSHGARETFTFCFFTTKYRNSKVITGKGFVDFEHFFSLSNSFCFCFMGSMSFLPEEFCRAKEKTWTKFPSNHISPLIQQNREVSV